jgi:hypothetical protein
LDSRAELLIEELATLPREGSVDFQYWRERFQLLFREELDPGSRQALLGCYSTMLDLAERSLISQGGDAEAFRNARKADWNMLCIQEALQRSETDLFSPDDLNEIAQREVAAGRMQESDFTRLAVDGADVLGNTAKKNSSKKGILRRIFDFD